MNYNELNLTTCPNRMTKVTKPIVRISRSGMISFSNEAVNSLELTEGGGGSLSPCR